MQLLALDLGAHLGWAWGSSSVHPPEIGCERLCPGESVETRAGALGAFLRDFMRERGRPEKIVVENFLRPAASFSEDATVGQILLHGTVHCIAGMAGIGVVAVAAASARKHFCGQASALPHGRGKRTSAQKNEARKATKQMVIGRARLLGYLPRLNEPMAFERECAMADAACVFDWAKVYVARTSPHELVMFESQPPGRQTIGNRSEKRQRMVS